MIIKTNKIEISKVEEMNRNLLRIGINKVDTRNGDGIQRRRLLREGEEYKL